MKKFIDELLSGAKLDMDSARALMLHILDEEWPTEQLAAILTVYRVRPVSADELLGFRTALMARARRVEFPVAQSVDIVGTGGDGKNSFNISTLAAIVTAGAGYPVTKHGNYGSTSVSGSSDVLQSLGYVFTNDTNRLVDQLVKTNICFLHAPLFHPALKKVAATRKNLGFRTIFNLLGPIANPSDPSHFVLGVADKSIVDTYQSVMDGSQKNYTIVHSEDGYDEISGTARAVIRSNHGMSGTFSPEDLYMGQAKEADLYGGETIEAAAKIFVDVLEGRGTDYQNNAVLSNAAVAIASLSGESYAMALDEAKESLMSGAAKNCFSKLVEISAA